MELRIFTEPQQGASYDDLLAVAATAAARALGSDHPIVTLATAHPAKFPDAVERATGVRPALPPHLEDLYERAERTCTLANDLAEVQGFVRSVTRITS